MADVESSTMEMERALCRGYQMRRKRASANEFRLDLGHYRPLEPLFGPATT